MRTIETNWLKVLKTKCAILTIFWRMKTNVNKLLWPINSLKEEIVEKWLLMIWMKGQAINRRKSKFFKKRREYLRMNSKKYLKMEWRTPNCSKLLKRKKQLKLRNLKGRCWRSRIWSDKSTWTDWRMLRMTRRRSALWMKCKGDYNR